MKLLLAILIAIPTMGFANTENISWKKFQIPYRYSLKKDITNHKKCSNPDIVINEVLKRNNITEIKSLRVGDWIELPACNGIESMYSSPPPEPIKKNNSKIFSWNEFITPKGYVLSKDLSINQKCAQIWTKQIFEFQKKNPTVENPNDIPKNKKIFVQRCYETIKAKKDGEQTKDEEMNSMVNDYLIYEGRFDVYLGMSNFKDKFSHAIGIGARGNILKDKGYEVKIFNFGSSSILLGEIELKEHNNYKYQKKLTVGIAEYFLNEEYPAVSGSSVYATVGMIARPTPRWIAELEIGSGLSSQLSPIIQTNAMKRFNNVWIGGFIEARSLNNPLFNNRDNLILSGLKLSF